MCENSAKFCNGIGVSSKSTIFKAEILKKMKRHGCLSTENNIIDKNFAKF